VTLRIEPLAPDQWTRWREVRVRALREDPDAFACSAHQLGAEAPESAWREALEDRTVLLAVDDEGRDVGMVGVRSGEDPELVSMWVAPEARQGGVGRALVAAVVVEAAQRPLHLRVMAQNASAIGFYSGCGFALVDGEPDDEGTLTMLRDASPAPVVWPAPAERPLRPGAPRPGPTADQ